MTRLYWCADYQRHWIAYTPEAGYVIFPATEDGWIQRTPFCDFDLSRIREVPAHLSFNTGFPVENGRKRHKTAA